MRSCSILVNERDHTKTNAGSATDADRSTSSIALPNGCEI
ncbi:hypothetical protein LBWT_X4790 (plasmid) [Leptolyngbya boryana IAM M-101]|nr:hypothetical protein LBWT_X4790 [Leptolyngbya boryana IAM M-101]BAS66755.1 hypothetical protein LBDG_X4790 [Leptolyngbya boryana dg5]